MTLPRPLARDRTDRLATVGTPVDPPRASPRPDRTTAGLRQRLRAVAGRTLRASGQRLWPELPGALDAVGHRLDGVDGELEHLRPLAVQQRLTEADVRANTVNQELLKGEFRELRHLVDELGFAIAPGAGLDAAQERLAELRERVNGLERRFRSLAAPGPAPRPGKPAPAESSPVESSPVRAAPRSALFDYVGFERRFRGDPEAVSATLWERYGEQLTSHPPVLDIGCGRAELLLRLRADGVEALGVDTDPSMVAEARDKGLDVHELDGTAYLRDRPEHSLGAIIATHVAEHLDLDGLIELLELAATRLRPGGVFIAETPNPQSLIVLGNSFILDPTHVRPLHPSLFTFLCEGAGFRDVRLRFFAPAESYRLPRVVPDPPRPPAADLAAVQSCAATVNAAFDRLDEVLFGPQDYAVIATAAASRSD